MGEGFKEIKGDIFSVDLFWKILISYYRFNHLSKAYTSIWTSNKRIPNLTCTFKGVPPPKWLLVEGPLDAIDSR
jgi:hypothetical protein